MDGRTQQRPGVGFSARSHQQHGQAPARSHHLARHLGAGEPFRRLLALWLLLCKSSWTLVLHVQQRLWRGG